MVPPPNNLIAAEKRFTECRQQLNNQKSDQQQLSLRQTNCGFPPWISVSLSSSYQSVQPEQTDHCL